MVRRRTIHGSFFQKRKGRVLEEEFIRMLMGIILSQKLLLLLEYMFSATDGLSSNM